MAHEAMTEPGRTPRELHPGNQAHPLKAPKRRKLRSTLTSAIKDIKLTDREERKAIRSYKFKTMKLREELTSRERADALDRKVKSLIKLIDKLKSKLRHKTSPNPKSKEDRANYRERLRHRKDDINASFFKHMPQHLHGKKFIDICRILNSTENLMSTRTNVTCSDLEPWDTMPCYQQRVDFINKHCKSKACLGISKYTHTDPQFACVPKESLPLAPETIKRVGTFNSSKAEIVKMVPNVDDTPKYSQRELQFMEYLEHENNRRDAGCVIM